MTTTQDAAAEFWDAIDRALKNPTNDGQDTAVKFYFYPFSAMIFSQQEWEDFIQEDLLTIRPDKVSWVVEEGGLRLQRHLQDRLRKNKDNYLSVIVYGLQQAEGPLDIVYHYAWGQAISIDVLQPWPMTPQKPTDVGIVDGRDVWVLRYKSLEHKTGRLRQRERPLYGHNTVEEAMTDAVAYFGGLVSREEIKLYQGN